MIQSICDLLLLLVLNDICHMFLNEYWVCAYLEVDVTTLY